MQKAAVRIENTDLTLLRLAHSSQFRVLRDPDGNSLFELTACGKPVMGFLFRKYPEPAMNWKRDSIARAMYPLSDFPISEEESYGLVPVIHVSALPERDLWQLHSTLGEDLFWCAEDARLIVQAMRSGGCRIELWNRESNAAYMKFRDRAADDEAMLTLALRLRSAFHIPSPIKVSSFYNKKTISWYYPIAV